MQKIFTGLENAFVGTGWSWKPHKSKEHIFLHRYWYPKKNPAHKKNKIIFDRKKHSTNKSDEKKSIFSPSKMRFSENQLFSMVFWDFSKIERTKIRTKNRSCYQQSRNCPRAQASIYRASWYSRHCWELLWCYGALRSVENRCGSANTKFENTSLSEGSGRYGLSSLSRSGLLRRVIWAGSGCGRTIRRVLDGRRNRETHICSLPSLHARISSGVCLHGFRGR